MDLRFRQNARLVTAKLDTSGGDGRLKSGSYGWHEESVIDWLHGWKLRCRVELTRKPSAPTDVSIGVTQTSGHPTTKLTLEGAELEVQWVLPDSIGIFTGGAFGTVAQWSLVLPQDTYYGQTRIVAQNRDPNALLKLAAAGLEFQSTRLGRPSLLEVLGWRLAASDRDSREAARQRYGLS